VRTRGEAGLEFGQTNSIGIEREGVFAWSPLTSSAAQQWLPDGVALSNKEVARPTADAPDVSHG